MQIKADVKLYTTPWCPFCTRAKGLLDRKGVKYNDINVDGNPQLRQEMMEKAGGRRTVPQIFINGQGIGGCDELHALEAAGRLDPMLAKAPA